LAAIVGGETSSLAQSVFEYEIRIRLHDTDAAGRLFFANLFRQAHDAFEAFMIAIGHPLDALIRDRTLLLPLIHAEADYRRPMAHGDQVRIQLWVRELRQRSFEMSYRFLDSQGQEAASAKTIHILVTGETQLAEALPEALRDALLPYCETV
jgi:1,4-dihydroxy-2-naphthoyl-CoA hydrolase